MVKHNQTKKNITFDENTKKIYVDFSPIQNEMDLYYIYMYYLYML